MNTTKQKRSALPNYLLGLTVGIAIGAVNGINGYKVLSDRVIPTVEQVQSGHVNPSDLEVQCKDLDGDGNMETILKIGDKTYFLQTADGEPNLIKYHITPEKVVYE